MTIQSRIFDLIIQKKAKFYQEFQQVEEDGVTPIPYVGFELKCRIKESHEATINVHELTEANGGIVRVDEDTGTFGILIEADETNIVTDNGVYDIIVINNNYPTTEIERIIEGKVTYTEGVT